MVEEVKVCACGLEMVPPHIGAVAVICPNCDSVQPTEYNGDEDGSGFRVPSIHDRRFNLEWTRRIRRYYPKAAA